MSFTEGFVKSMSMIGANEIGDKTFFIAAIMAMKQPRPLVLGGCLGALSVMTLLSAVIGGIVGNISGSLGGEQLTTYLAALLFFYFGARLLMDAFSSSDEPNSELEEVEAELSGKGDRVDGSKANASKIAVAVKKQLQVVLSPIVWKAFTMTFLAEWGDRSQIATITLAAEGDMLGVTLGK
mmetsp:Transcript_2806/g.10225  ORF Transcript_2806/g.10225 Transcript_2806/m.10225 type:complete len:181 (-) Transcript_2806:8-550(-)